MYRLPPAHGRSASTHKNLATSPCSRSPMISSRLTMKPASSSIRRLVGASKWLRNISAPGQQPVQAAQLPAPRLARKMPPGASHRRIWRNNRDDQKRACRMVHDELASCISRSCQCTMAERGLGKVRATPGHTKSRSGFCPLGVESAHTYNPVGQTPGRPRSAAKKQWLVDLGVQAPCPRRP